MHEMPRRNFIKGLFGAGAAAAGLDVTQSAEAARTSKSFSTADPEGDNIRPHQLDVLSPETGERAATGEENDPALDALRSNEPLTPEQFKALQNRFRIGPPQSE